MKIGELLVLNGLITEDQVQQALKAQSIYGGKLGTNLVELGFIKDVDLAKFLAKQLQMPAVAQKEIEEVPAYVLKLIKEDFVKEHRVIPLALDEKFKVALCDPYSVSALDELRFKHGKPIDAVVAPEIWIVAAMERYYRIPRESRYVEFEDDGNDEISFNNEIVSTVASMTDVADFTLKDLDQEKDVPFPAYANELLTAKTPIEVLNALFRFLTPLFPRMAIYANRKNGVQGWLLSGFAVHSRSFTEVSSPLNKAGVIQQAIETKKPVLQSTNATVRENPLFSLLDLTSDKTLGVYPLVVRGNIMCILLGEPRDKEAPKARAGSIVLEATSRAAMALEVLYLTRQIEAVPGTKRK